MLLQKKRALWLLSIVIVLCVAIFFFFIRDVSMKAFRDKMSGLSTTAEKIRYAKSIVKKQPKSEAALYATLVYLQVKNENGEALGTASQIATLKYILKYHPTSMETLLSLASLTQSTSPKESIDYAKRILRLEPLHLDSHIILGAMYQEVEDYTTALVYLKKAKALLAAHTEVPHTHESHTHGNKIDYVIEVNGEILSVDLDRFREHNLTRGIEAIEGGKPLYGDGIGQNPKHFMMFMLWIKQIERAKSHTELKTFLMREVASHLQGKHTEFSVERLMNAYKILEQHGKTEGIKQLQNSDSGLASAISKDM